jgi:hypothetical protein
MKKIKIETEDLIVALDTHLSEMTYFIDLETGEVLWASEYQEYNSGVTFKKMEKNPKRYFQIVPIPSNAGFKIMEEFVETLAEGMTKIRLQDAVYGEKPFRNFKEKLRYFPDLRTRWFKYYNQKMYEYCEKWLKDNNIEAELALIREEP